MSQLLDALNRISDWLEAYYPKAADFRPGLSLERIQELTKDLPFKFPIELCELYQWRNGGARGPSFNAELFPDAWFRSLEEVIEEYNRILENTFHEDERLMYLCRLTFISRGDAWFFMNCDKEDDESNQLIWLYQQGFYKVPCFKNLTQMMLTILECYETNVFYIDSNGYLDADWEKWSSSSILRELRDSNSDTVNHNDVEAKHLLRRWYEVITDWFSFFSGIK